MLLPSLQLVSIKKTRKSVLLCPCYGVLFFLMYLVCQILSLETPALNADSLAKQISPHAVNIFDTVQRSTPNTTLSRRISKPFRQQTEDDRGWYRSQLSRGSDGAMRRDWKVATGSPTMCPPTLGFGGNIFVTGVDQTIRSFSRFGEPLWKFKCRGRVWETPQLVSLIKSEEVSSDEWELESEMKLLHEAAQVLDKRRLFFHLDSKSVDKSEARLSPQGSSASQKASTSVMETSSHVVQSDSSESNPLKNLDLLYFGDDKGYLYVLDAATGDVVWELSLGKEILSGVRYNPVGNQLLVIVDYFLVSVDIWSGRQNWRSFIGARVLVPVGLRRDGGIVVATDDKWLIRFNSNGSELWRYSTSSTFQSPPVEAVDGSTIALTSSSELVCVDDQGVIQWTHLLYKSHESTSWSVPLVSPLPPHPVILMGANGEIVTIDTVSGMMGYVVDLASPLGQPILARINRESMPHTRTRFQNSATERFPRIFSKWETVDVPIPDKAFFEATPVHADAAMLQRKQQEETEWRQRVHDVTLLFGSDNRHLYAMSLDGKLKDKFFPEFNTLCQPAVGEDGLVVVADGAWLHILTVSVSTGDPSKPNHFYSNSISSRLCNATSCSSHGRCHPLTGACVCDPGWRGFDCNLRRCPSPCWNGGYCDGSTGACVCADSFLAPDCRNMHQSISSFDIFLGVSLLGIAFVIYIIIRSFIRVFFIDTKIASSSVNTSDFMADYEYSKAETLLGTTHQFKPRRPSAFADVTASSASLDASAASVDRSLMRRGSVSRQDLASSSRDLIGLTTVSGEDADSMPSLLERDTWALANNHNIVKKTLESRGWLKPKTAVSSISGATAHQLSVAGAGKKRMSKMEKKNRPVRKVVLESVPEHP